MVVYSYICLYTAMCKSLSLSLYIYIYIFVFLLYMFIYICDILGM